MWFHHEYVRDVLAALNIGIDDLAVFDRPVLLPHVRISDPAMKEHSHIHRKFGDFCCELGRQLGLPSQAGSSRPIAYMSRSRLTVGTAKFVNEVDLERALEDLGVEIVFPETLSLKQQLASIYLAKSVIGITGSALHLSAFCGSKSIIGISAGAAVNSNFRMIDAVCHNRACYVYPRNLAVVETPPNFHAAWRLEDPAATARDLVTLAASMPGHEPHVH